MIFLEFVGWKREYYGLFQLIGGVWVVAFAVMLVRTHLMTRLVGDVSSLANKVLNSKQDLQHKDARVLEGWIWKFV
jgi:hypothetical protein